MKACVTLLSCLILLGCGKQSELARQNPHTTNSMPPTREASPGPERSETKSVNNAYAKGVVTRKNGKEVAGHILLQCPGYLTVCFKINSSEPGSSELVAIEDVKRVVLDGAIDGVDPLWKKLQDAMTVVFGSAEETAVEGGTGRITRAGQPVANATVELVPADGASAASARTNANGRFEFGKGVAPGKYRVRVRLNHEASPKTGDGTKAKADTGKSSGGGASDEESGR